VSQNVNKQKDFRLGRYVRNINRFVCSRYKSFCDKITSMWYQESVCFWNKCTLYRKTNSLFSYSKLAVWARFRHWSIRCVSLYPCL